MNRGIFLVITVLSFSLITLGFFVLSGASVPAFAMSTDDDDLPFEYEIGDEVIYQDQVLIVWGYFKSKHKENRKVYDYYLLANGKGNKPIFVWRGAIDNVGPSDEPPPGDCPNPPGYPCRYNLDGEWDEDENH